MPDKTLETITTILETINTNEKFLNFLGRSKSTPFESTQFVLRALDAKYKFYQENPAQITEEIKQIWFEISSTIIDCIVDNYFTNPTSPSELTKEESSLLWEESLLYNECITKIFLEYVPRFGFKEPFANKNLIQFLLSGSIISYGLYKLLKAKPYEEMIKDLLLKNDDVFIKQLREAVVKNYPNDFKSFDSSQRKMKMMIQ